MNCMDRLHKHILCVWTVLPVLLFLFSACARGDYLDTDSYDSRYAWRPLDDFSSQAVGTVKSRGEVRFIQLDPVSAGFVVNPDYLGGIADGTRVFLQYRTVVSPDTPDFCTDAILLEGVSPLDMGDIRSSVPADPGDPLAIVTDWITCLEDGFLTLHYALLSKGKATHSFSLYPSGTPYDFVLVHDAHGDTEGERADGIVCFALDGLLPETGDETIMLSMTYLNIGNTKQTLTFEYRSPK